MSRAPRQVIVSGGTGALGRAVTAAFLAANDRVVVPWIDAGERAEIERVEADALRATRLELVEADVAEASGAAAVAAATGAVDILVNGVGGFAGGQPVWETELALWQDTTVRSPEFSDGHVNLGAANLRAGRLDEAEAAYRRGHELGNPKGEIGLWVVDERRRQQRD